jgi:putative FmdB family regulatory protein
MPIYEYRCSGCDGRYEEWVGVGEVNKRGCPHCGRAERTRVPSRFAITAVPANQDGGSTAAGPCCGGNSASCGCR